MPDADRLITFKIEDDGTLIGVDNGDFRSNDSYKGNSRTTYWGRCLAVVQATKKREQPELQPQRLDYLRLYLIFKQNINKRKQVWINII